MQWLQHFRIKERNMLLATNVLLDELNLFVGVGAHFFLAALVHDRNSADAGDGGHDQALFPDVD